MLIPLIGLSQSNNQYTLGGGMNFGLQSTGGGTFEVVGEILRYKEGRRFNNGLSLGFGIGLPYDVPVVGDDYNGIIFEVDPQDLMHKGIKKDAGVYFQGGLTINRFSFGGRIGSYSTSKYEQGFNNIMGLHYITWSDKGYLLGGFFANIKIMKWIAISGGYDNYIGEFLGFNLRHTFARH